MQEGLARYEMSGARARFSGAEMNLGDAIKRIEARQKPDGTRSEVIKPAWRQALERARLPLYDVHWDSAVVVERSGGGKTGEALRVGLRDGRIVPISNIGTAVRRSLSLYDVVYVRVVEDGKSRSARAELRVRPTVQGAALVLENKTGRILAMAGGFSYPLSQLNRVAQAARQPGSALKPLTFLAALEQRPATEHDGARSTTSRCRRSAAAAMRARRTTGRRRTTAAAPRAPMTLRAALENSRNLVTARLLDGAIKKKPEESLKQVCTLAKETHIYPDCIPYYPFVLGAQPVRVIDLATFYATIANEGMRPEPHAVEAVEQRRRGALSPPGYAAGPRSTPPTRSRSSSSRASCRACSHAAPHAASAIWRRYVGGKTGTSTDWNDAWFVGFTNDVTVAVWVGYDNAGGKRRTLGSGGTGSGTAIPIFEPIIKASWEHVAPQAALAPPTPRNQAPARCDLRRPSRIRRRQRG